VAPTRAVVQPPTNEDFAKVQIQDVLKAYCNAFEAIDPAGVQRVFPKAPMDTLRAQLNAATYKSMQCKFGDPMFLSLNAANGSATVQAGLKRVFEFTSTAKPDTLELIVDMTLSRPNPGGSWQIDTMTFKPKRPSQ
jgi:hypothetical protein